MTTYEQIMEHMPPDAGPLVFPVAVTANDTAKFIDLARAPHMLFAGTTGSGKSVALNVAVATIIDRTTADEVEFTMIDPKRVELAPYEPAASVRAVITDMDAAAETITEIVSDMEARYDALKDAGVKKLSDYNEANPDAALPHHVLVVDELSDLMDTHKSVVLPGLARIAQLGRAAGIHMILATQRPAADTIPKKLLGNVPTRVALTCQSHTESRLIIGESGAEDLDGMGDMLVQVPGEKGLTRGQGPWLDDDALAEIIESNRDPHHRTVEQVADDIEDGGDDPDPEAEPVGREDVADMLAGLIPTRAPENDAQVADLYERIIAAEREQERLEYELRTAITSLDDAEDELEEAREGLRRRKDEVEVLNQDIESLRVILAGEREKASAAERSELAMFYAAVNGGTGAKAKVLLVFGATLIVILAIIAGTVLAGVIATVGAGVIAAASMVSMDSRLKERVRSARRSEHLPSGDRTRGR